MGFTIGWRSQGEVARTRKDGEKVDQGTGWQRIATSQSQREASGTEVAPNTQHSFLAADQGIHRGGFFLSPAIRDVASNTPWQFCSVAWSILGKVEWIEGEDDNKERKKIAAAEEGAKERLSET